MLVLAQAKSQSRRSLQWSSGGTGGASGSGAAGASGGGGGGGGSGSDAKYIVTHRIPLRAVRCLSDEELWGKPGRNGVNIMWDRPSPYAPVCIFLAPLGLPPRKSGGARGAKNGAVDEIAAGAAAAGVAIEWDRCYARASTSAGGDYDENVREQRRRHVREVFVNGVRCEAMG